MSGPRVTVHYRDQALAALVADAARTVAGVVRLQGRPAARVVNRVRGRGADTSPVDTPPADTSAVDLVRDGRGALEVSVRLVSTLAPAPPAVVDAVVDAVRNRLAGVGEHAVRVEVTVTDVGI